MFLDVSSTLTVSTNISIPHFTVLSEVRDVCYFRHLERESMPESFYLIILLRTLLPLALILISLVAAYLRIGPIPCSIETMLEASG